MRQKIYCAYPSSYRTTAGNEEVDKQIRKIDISKYPSDVWIDMICVEDYLYPYIHRSAKTTKTFEDLGWLVTSGFGKGTKVVIPKGEVFHLKYVVGAGEELQYKLEGSSFIVAFGNLPENIPDSFRNFFEPIN